MKTIGLIGGMSWESTAHYYALLNRETASRLGGLHSAPVIVHSVDFAPIAEMQSADRWDEAGDILATSPNAMQLRYFAALHDVAGNRTSTIVFPVPIDLLSKLQGDKE